jgi:hypothetical protein
MVRTRWFSRGKNHYRWPLRNPRQHFEHATLRSRHRAHTIELHIPTWGISMRTTSACPILCQQGHNLVALRAGFLERRYVGTSAFFENFGARGAFGRLEF